MIKATVMWAAAAGLSWGICHFSPPASAQEAKEGHDFVEIRNPRTLAMDRLSAERVPIGDAVDYKPCLALLPNGELLLIGLHAPPGNIPGERIFMYRSVDGGKTWSQREQLDLVGREPYLSMLDNGTIFVTTHVIPGARGSTEGYVYSTLNRSTDGGRNWESTKVVYNDSLASARRDGQNASASQVVTSRNVRELRDGTLVFAVGAHNGAETLWRSKDKGKTWDKSLRCQFDTMDLASYPYSIFEESVLWQAPNDDLLSLCRVDSRNAPKLPSSTIPREESDHFNRLVLYRSTNGGETWTFSELGNYYGEMYPSILRLKDGRLLLTFTLRAAVAPNKPPLGVQAVLGEETRDGFDFDFKHDRIMLDVKTPVDQYSGGGFGNTVQLDDGTLVTAYSYGTADEKTHCEVTRWRLPER